MSIIRFDDMWLRNTKVSTDIQNYLLSHHHKSVHEATLTYTGGLTGGFSVELMVELNDDHPHSDNVEDDIYEILIQARLDFAQCHVLRSLAWGFSSPAQTSKFRELLEQRGS